MIRYKKLNLGDTCINKVANPMWISDLMKIGLRRERDSNPRYVSVRRFSRPLQSTTLPSLLVLHMMDNLQCECGGFPKASAKLKEIFVLAKFSFDFFVVACYFVCFSALDLSTPLALSIGLLRPLAISLLTKREQGADDHSE